MVLVLVAIFAPVIATEDPIEQNYGATLRPPNREHLMGTDNFGRDIFSRVVYGSRISLQVGLISVGIAAAIGIPLGLAAGYYGGWVDGVAMRLVDVMLASHCSVSVGTLSSRQQQRSTSRSKLPPSRPSSSRWRVASSSSCFPAHLPVAALARSHSAAS